MTVRSKKTTPLKSSWIRVPTEIFTTITSFPLPTRAERRVVKGDKQIAWDTPWRSNTRRRKDGWDAEIALPLYAFAGQGDLAAARLNVCRNQTVFGLDGIGERTVRQMDWSSWSQVKRTYHETEQFGRVHGLAALWRSQQQHGEQR